MKLGQCAMCFEIGTDIISLKKEQTKQLLLVASTTDSHRFAFRSLL